MQQTFEGLDPDDSSFKALNLILAAWDEGTECGVPPEQMAYAMRLAVAAGHSARAAGRIPRRWHAQATKKPLRLLGARLTVGHQWQRRALRNRLGEETFGGWAGQQRQY